VASPKAVFPFPWTPLGQSLVPGLLQFLRVVRVHPERPGRTQLLLEGRAREAHPAGIDERHEAAFVGCPDHRRRRVRQLAKASLAVANDSVVPRSLGGRAEQVGE